MRRLLALVGAVALLAALADPATAAIGIPWHPAHPVTTVCFVDGSPFPDDVAAKAAEWSLPAGLDVVSAADCSAYSRVVYIVAGDYGTSIGSARGYPIIKGHWLVGGTLYFNLYYSAVWGVTDLRLFTICHEMGHFLGLDHDNSSGIDYEHGCMNVNWQGPSPSQRSYDELAQLYG
jgi:hypothetical protein